MPTANRSPAVRGRPPVDVKHRVKRLERPAGRPQCLSTGGRRERSAVLRDVAVGSSAKANAKADNGKYKEFVHHFRQASPYIVGHREKTFVVVIPGEVVARDDLLASALEDLTLLHGMGVQLVIVVGSQCQINSSLSSMGQEPQFVDGYRITDEAALRASVDAAGQARIKVEGFFSKAPPMPMVRRHEKYGGAFRHLPHLRVVGGNYVVAKRRGIVEGVDFQLTGEVRCILRDAIDSQLQLGNIVLLNNLGYGATGNVLNCNVYDVGLHAAVEMRADKVFCLHLDDVTDLGLQHWIPLSEAYHLIGGKPRRTINGIGSALDLNGSRDFASEGRGSLSVDLNRLSQNSLPRPVLMSVMACDQGVKRAHLVNAEVDGGLLLELYTRDGIGTMISTDFYQGIRPAVPADLRDIQELLEPLALEGTTVRRSAEELAGDLNNFKVFEQEGKVLGCALVKEVGLCAEGGRVIEVAAFCVHPSMRGQGKGDSMLEYIEQDARSRGVRRLVLLTTRTADWFLQRGFEGVGPAISSKLIPEARRSMISAARNSQLYIKEFQEWEGTTEATKRWVGY
ncbi:hypothetical protein BSKO_06079 [Bryopsis sp. KO-2023]|nr:hypothetical protein BSKO_06079 [Bryopsis sp. KO-2023]